MTACGFIQAWWLLSLVLPQAPSFLTQKERFRSLPPSCLEQLAEQFARSSLLVINLGSTGQKLS